MCGVSMDLSIELIIVLCGLILSGVPYVPLEPNLPDQRLSYIINDCQISIIIGKDQHEKYLFNDQIKYIELNDLIENEIDKEIKLNEKLNEETIYCIMYTSGSTGHPKGVRLSHRALLNRLFWQWNSFPYEQNEVCCLKTSISFVGSIAELFGPLLKGIRLIIIPKSLLMDINQLIKTFNEHSLTRLIVVPSLLSVLGENLSPNLIEKFFDIYPSNSELLNLYGSTEVMADVTYEIFSSIDHLKEKCFDGRTSIGIPIDNMRVDILNPDQNHIGEIVVSGPGVADGYHHTQFVNEKFLLDTNLKGKLAFRTGDLAKIWNERLILFGRSDYQVKIAGNRVNLNEIELILKIHFSGKIDRHALLHSINENNNEQIKEEFSSSIGTRFSRVLEQFHIQQSNIDRNFFAAGGSSLNALLIVAKLHAEGFHHLTVQYLINSPTLRDIELDICASNNQTDRYFAEEIEDENHFHFIPLEEVNQEDALQILTQSFVTHGEIDTLIHQHRQQLKQEFSRQWEYFMNFNWDTYRTSNLSFGVLDENSRLIGLSLSYDMAFPPPISPLEDQMTLLSPLNTLIDILLFQRYYQLNTCEHLTRIMRSHVTTVHPHLTPGQRLTTIYFIEKHLLDVAKTNHYQAVITANTSSVTQQLAEHVLKYDTHHQTLVHSFSHPSTGKLLFPNAPNHYSVIISVKYISS